LDNKKDFIDISTSKSSNLDLNRGLLEDETQSPLYQPTNITTGESNMDANSILSIQENRSPPQTFKEELARILRVFNLVKVPAVSVTYVFTVTIGIFPALIVLIQSTNYCKSTSDRFSNDLFVPFMFLLFNLFDLIGRFVAGTFPLVLDKKSVWFAALARSIFFPAFMLCNVIDTQLPVLFDNDACPIIFMILFAFTNGYVATACMVLGPTLVFSQDSSLAGTIMAFSLTLGLLLGACTSFLVVFTTRGSVE
jgi:solute carrier family 29 (equilibrative nucleoside transporter), member 1/2/3